MSALNSLLGGIFMKLSTYKGVPEKVLPIVRSAVEAEGLWLWDIEFYKEGSEQILCITLDSENGINIEDCERVSRAIDGPLDEADPISCEYYLQVSSPGIERDLKKREHFEAFIGDDVRVSLYAARKEGVFAGMKVICATLAEISEDGLSITLESDCQREEILFENIAGVKTVYEY